MKNNRYRIIPTFKYLNCFTDLFKHLFFDWWNTTYRIINHAWECDEKHKIIHCMRFVAMGYYLTTISIYAVKNIINLISCVCVNCAHRHIMLHRERIRFTLLLFYTLHLVHTREIDRIYNMRLLHTQVADTCV